ncbi:MAG: hypothetical protein JWQ81_8537 [Amycolatopsis sp.]|uniref:hypothetical protein n=1 Tax=Amycolatopsis sp. TaxID=37632 RepID=UPI00261DE51D|nr:hypothetical protein [Amycolatopsis sp.]MCU1687798.1 hypothetical protein [Amycolatopsis sp.]
MIPWKVFWSTLAAVTTFAGAGIAALYAVTLWLALPATVVVAVVVTRVARLVIYRAAVMDGVPLRSRVMMLGWITAAIYVHAGVAAAFLLRPDLWALWAVVTAAVGAATYGVARAHEYLLARPSAAPARQVTSAITTTISGAVIDEGDPVRAKVLAGLRLAGFDWLDVGDWIPMGGDPELDKPADGIIIDVQVPSAHALAEKGHKGKAGSTLGITEAKQIAIGLREALQAPTLASDWVSLEEQPEAGAHLLTIATRDVMADVFPYEDDCTWTSIREPSICGRQLNGLRYGLRLDQHGQVVGGTRWGKSSLIDSNIGHVTRCRDAKQWIGGTTKVYDLVAGWLMPYMDTDLDLPIDYVANGAHDTLAMMIAGLNIAQWRQSQPMDQRGNWPTIIIDIDEASDALGDNSVKLPYRGVLITMSQAAAKIYKGAGSGDVWLHLASQRDTMDQWGDKGGDVMANVQWAAGFHTADQGSLGRLLGSYKLPNPRHKGEYYLNPGNGDGLVRLKAPYVQTIDKSKPRLHDGPTVSDVAWSRRNFHTAMDPGSAHAGGAAYANRHRRMNAAMLAYITTGEAGGQAQIEFSPAVTTPPPAAAQLAVAGPKQAGYELATRELDALLGVPEPRAVPVAAEAPGVASMVGRQSLADRIVDVVRAAPGPMSRVEIGAAMHPAGEQVVTNALSKLVASGVLSRPERRLYTAALCDAP